MAQICCDICLAPCKAIGYCCLGCERGCEACCNGCGRCCNSCCGLCPKDRPSPIFLSFTLFCNAPLVVLGVVTAIMSFAQGKAGEARCSAFMHPGIWLLIAAALALFFCGYAVHVHRLLCQHAAHGDLETGYQTQSARKEFSSKVWHIACHDVGTFFYFFAVPASIVWSIIGFAQFSFDGCGVLDWAVPLCAAVAIIYLLLHWFVAMTSCCWELGRSRSRTHGHQAGASGQPVSPSAQDALMSPQHAPAKMLQHVLVPGFQAYGQPVSHPAAAPPTAPTAAPPPGKQTMYPASGPPDPYAGQSAAYAAPYSPTALPADSQQPQGMFGRMQAAYQGARK